METEKNGNAKRKRKKTTSTGPVIIEGRPKSKIVQYWESLGDAKGEIVNMRMVLK
ncbi:MAG: hypothetical protein LBU37_02660 [Tannerellaceae bacterium]|jgi:hypothetical protein|nr:hypothetical protein [Tannerellaceae bacterium]